MATRAGLAGNRSGAFGSLLRRRGGFIPLRALSFVPIQRVESRAKLAGSARIKAGALVEKPFLQTLGFPKAIAGVAALAVATESRGLVGTKKLERAFGGLELVRSGDVRLFEPVWQSPVVSTELPSGAEHSGHASGREHCRRRRQQFPARTRDRRVGIAAGCAAARAANHGRTAARSLGPVPARDRLAVRRVALRRHFFIFGERIAIRVQLRSDIRDAAGGRLILFSRQDELHRRAALDAAGPDDFARRRPGSSRAGSIPRAVTLDELFTPGLFSARTGQPSWLAPPRAAEKTRLCDELVNHSEPEDPPAWFSGLVP